MKDFVKDYLNGGDQFRHGFLTCVDFLIANDNISEEAKEQISNAIFEDLIIQAQKIRLSTAEIRRPIPNSAMSGFGVQTALRKESL